MDDTFLDESVFDDGLELIETERGFAHLRKIAAAVQIDIDDRGPLFLFVQNRRKIAADALKTLATIDPGDTVGIVRAQVNVQEYLTAAHWAASLIEAGSAQNDAPRGNDDHHY